MFEAFALPINFRRLFSSSERNSAQGNFLVDGWEYESEIQVLRLAQTIEHKTGFSADNLQRLFKEGGGKAFGLEICKLMAKKNPSDFEVPAYQMVRPGQNFVVPALDKKSPDSEVYMRSSGYKEDYVESTAGKETSKLVKPGERMGIVIPYVAQKYVEGYGMVVDIVNSGGRPVIKISSGRSEVNAMRGRVYTSATSDSEASVVVYGINGQELFSMQGFGHVTAFEEGRKDFSRIAQKLYAACLSVGIDFGVQMELIVDPYNNKVQLVQIRPSPEKMRQMVGKSVEQENDREGRSLLKTNIVSGPFRVDGRVQILSSRQDQSDLMNWTGQNFKDLRFNKENLPKILALAQEAHESADGKVFFSPTHDGNLRGKGDMGDPNNFPLALLAAYASGAKAFIRQGPIWPNTTHNDLVRPSYLSLEIQRFLESKLAMVSVTPEQSSVLKRALQDAPNANLRVRSDGLVGEVFIL